MNIILEYPIKGVNKFLLASGSGLSDVEGAIKWPYYQAMMFLLQSEDYGSGIKGTIQLLQENVCCPNYRITTSNFKTSQN